jgi:hypothetical protein
MMAVPGDWVVIAGTKPPILAVGFSRHRRKRPEMTNDSRRFLLCTSPIPWQPDPVVPPCPVLSAAPVLYSA